MATIEYWIQLENRPWDVCPNNRDRMTGQTLIFREGKGSEKVTLKSPGTNVTRKDVVMYKPLRDLDGKTVIDALILRRYRKPSPFTAPGHPPIGPWEVPDDRKVNP